MAYISLYAGGMKKSILVLAALVVLLGGAATVKADPTNGTIWVWEVTFEEPSRAAWYDHYEPCSTFWAGATTGKVRCAGSSPSGSAGSPYQSAPVSILD